MSSYFAKIAKKGFSYVFNAIMMRAQMRDELTRRLGVVVSVFFIYFICNTVTLSFRLSTFFDRAKHVQA